MCRTGVTEGRAICTAKSNRAGKGAPEDVMSLITRYDPDQVYCKGAPPQWGGVAYILYIIRNVLSVSMESDISLLGCANGTSVICRFQVNYIYQGGKVMHVRKLDDHLGSAPRWVDVILMARCGLDKQSPYSITLTIIYHSDTHCFTP